jgi:hypothetical protein
MKAPVRNFIIRDATGTREAETLVIGRGIPLSTTAGGLPELESLLPGQGQLMPSGGDDTQAIRDALAGLGGVRLGPGEFNVSGSIALDTGQSVAGCGSLRTTVRTTHGGAVFSLSGGSALEELALSGPGASVAGSVGVAAASGADVRLRGLRVENLERGVYLTGVVHATISGVTVQGTGLDGIAVAGGGGAVSVSDVTVSNTGGTGLSLASLSRLVCTGVTVRNSGTGIDVNQANSFVLQAIRVQSCSHGMTIKGGGGEVSGAVLFSCESNFLVQASAVALTGCTVRGAEASSLVIRSCTGVLVNAFYSDMNGALSAVTPHVLVDGGSTLVTFTGIHRVGPSIPQQYEVDVSAAGGRVVFIQHDFDPARINSGGNFAAL